MPTCTCRPKIRSSPSRGSASAINVSMCARSRPSASTIWYSSSTPRVSQSPFTPARLAPELVESVRVLGEGPALRDLAVLEVEGVDGLRADALPVALGRARREDRPVLVVGDDGVPLELEGPATELHELAEEAEDLVLSPVVAGNLAPAGDVERHVLGEEPSERVQVTLLEGVVALVQQIGVRMRHASPSRSIIHPDPIRPKGSRIEPLPRTDGQARIAACPGARRRP